MGSDRILYLGYFYPLDVVKSRGLPFQNIAGNNRMKRVTGALTSAGLRVHLASPGVCAACRFTGKLLHGAYRSFEDGVEILIAPAVGVPIVGALFEILLFPLWTFQLLHRVRFAGVVMYNYSPSLVIVAAALRVLGVPFIAQIEDVAMPSKSDWRVSSETRPVHQIMHWLCMKLVTALSSGLIVPSRRFLPFLPQKKPWLVLPGCVADSEWSRADSGDLRGRIRVLFAGKYEREHGMDLLVAAITLLRTSGIAGRYVFDCCGTATYPLELQSLGASNGTPEVRLHGLLSDAQYRALLSEVDVALVLQKSDGRHAKLKSPSKAYEFLAAGKLVIATDVGDIWTHGADNLVLLQRESAEGLAETLEDIAGNPTKYEDIRRNSRDLSGREFTFRAVREKLVSFLSQSAGFRTTRTNESHPECEEQSVSGTRHSRPLE